MRAFGLGSILGKTLRDSAGTGLIVAGLLVVMLIGGGATMASTYGTPSARLELGALATMIPPALRGVYGNPVNVGTLGGFITWHYGAYFALITGLWSLLALSATLGAEALSGRLDLVATTQRSRRSIALAKVGGHAMAVGAVALLVSVSTWLVGAVSSTFPEDAVSAGAALGFGVGLAVRGLAAGAIAFAAAPFLGRGPAAGVAGVVMVGGYLANGYRSVLPALDALAPATWWSWTAGHLPLAGVTDWGGVAITAIAIAALLALGVEAFARRDIGVTIDIRGPATPSALLGVRGPFARGLGELLPQAIAWASGLTAYGLVMAAASGSLIDLLAGSPGLVIAWRAMVPNIDITASAGFLQFAFVDLGFVFIGLAVAALAGGRWSDETSGRFELLATTPMTRARWVLANGAALGVAVAAITVLLAAAIAGGIASLGQAPWEAARGTLVLGAYGAALTGIGMAVGGLAGGSRAGAAVAAVAVGTFLLDTLAPVLRLPGWVAELALTTHLGEPLVGRWDVAGLAACAVLAAGGLAVGAWGIRRRDLD